MKHEDKMVISHRPYAVDLLSLYVHEHGRATMNAVWFRRRNGVLVACTGYLWDYQTPDPSTATEFLHNHTDGRYGGTCLGRWDGERYWGAQEPAEIERHLELLRLMLTNYPNVPAGFDGWWRF